MYTILRYNICMLCVINFLCCNLDNVKSSSTQQTSICIYMGFAFTYCTNLTILNMDENISSNKEDNQHLHFASAQGFGKQNPKRMALFIKIILLKLLVRAGPLLSPWSYVFGNIRTASQLVRLLVWDFNREFLFKSHNKLHPV